MRQQLPLQYAGVKADLNGQYEILDCAAAVRSAGIFGIPGGPICPGARPRIAECLLYMRLPGLDDERVCQIEIPEGYYANRDKLRFPLS